MQARMIVSAVIVGALASTVAISDPPTPPERPERWDFIGKYHIGVGPGLESVDAVIDPNLITRNGNIVGVFVGRGFVEENNEWQRGPIWTIASYKIDCKYHTYDEEFFENDRGVQDMPETWTTVVPDSEVGLAAKKVCVAPPAKAQPRH